MNQNPRKGRSKSGIRNREQGFILVAVLSLAVFVLLLGSGMAFMAESSLAVQRNARSALRAQQAAHAAAESAVALLNQQPDLQMWKGPQTIAPPLEPGMRAAATLTVLQATGPSPLIEVHAVGWAEHQARQETQMLVKGEHLLDPGVFSGVVSNGQVQLRGHVELSGGARLGATQGIVQSGTSQSAFSTEKEQVSPVQVPVPDLQKKLQTPAGCDRTLGHTVVSSELQARTLFEGDQTVCVLEGLVFTVPVHLSGVKLQVEGPVTLASGSLLKHSVLAARGDVQGTGLALKDSTLVSQADLVLQDLDVQGKVLLGSAGKQGLQLREQDSPGHLAVVSGGQVEFHMSGNVHAVVWSGGGVHQQGQGVLYGAIAARGDIWLDGGLELHLEQPAADPVFPGRYRFRVVSQN